MEAEEPTLTATELLEKFARDTEKLRAEGLFEGLEDKGSDPFAVEHYLLALSALEQAHRHFKLASYFQVRACAEARR